MEECLESLDISYDNENAIAINQLATTSSQDSIKGKSDSSKKLATINESTPSPSPASASKNAAALATAADFESEMFANMFSHNSSGSSQTNTDIELFLNTFNVLSQKKNQLNALLRSLSSIKTSNSQVASNQNNDDGGDERDDEDEDEEDEDEEQMNRQIASDEYLNELKDYTANRLRYLPVNFAKIFKLFQNEFLVRKD
jgi:hypothetical protein